MDMISNREKYINLSTKKRDGSYVNTPVWFAQAGETNNFYIFSLKKAGKVKRIRNFPTVKVAPCNIKGKLTGDWIDAKAELIDGPENTKTAYSYLRKKYGLMLRISDFFSKLVGNYHRRQIIRFSIETTD